MRILILALAAFLFTSPVFAHSFQTAEIKIGHPWSVPTGEGASDGEAYLAFFNLGKNGDQLVGATTSIARKVTLVHGGATVNAIDLPSNRGVSLIPGGSYLKLEGLKGGLAVGDKFTLRLTFAAAPPVDVIVFVEEHAGH